MRLKAISGVAASAVAFTVALAVMAACGELTGPKSPSTPINVVATLVGATTATITWTPSPQNDGVISYTVYRNGNKLGESATPSYTDATLAQQTTYVYSVAANCTSGVVSDRSVENEASTVTTVDVTPPSITAHQPPTNFNGVAAGATVTVTFSEQMSPATITSDNFTIRVTGGAVLPATVTYNATTKVAELTPTGGLPNPASITATVTTGVKDLAGNALAAPFSWAFITRDEAPPTVIAATPANNATGVSPTTPITVTFSEAMDANTITGANITLKVTASSAAVPGTVTYSTSTRVATFTPTSALAQQTGYTLTVSTGVKDVAGNAMAANYVLVFTTGDTTSPTVTAVVPVPGATGVALATTVKLTFSEAMDGTTVNATTVTLKPTAGGSNIAASVVYDPATLTATLTPTAALAPNTSYTVTVSTGAKDASGNPLAAPFGSTFTTINNDTTAPTISSRTPAVGATNVPVNTTVIVTFNEPMDAATITGTTNITLKPTVGSAVAATLSCNTPAPCTTATLTPGAPLLNNTNYTVTVTTGVKDVAGNALAAQSTWTFTTVADTIAPTILATVPRSDSTGVAVGSVVTVTFSEAMDATTINGTLTNFTLKTTVGSTPVVGSVSYNSVTHVATFTPTLPLAPATGYTATVTTGVKDTAGNALATNAIFSFTTAP